jgi:hypothetical protein
MLRVMTKIKKMHDATVIAAAIVHPFRQLGMCELPPHVSGPAEIYITAGKPRI